MEKDMTSGSPLKLIFWFSIPVLLGNIFQQFYNMADAIIVGRLLGEDALAAVGATGSIMFLVLYFAIGIAQGFGVMIAQAYGAKNERLLKHYVALSILLTLIISVAVTAFTPDADGYADSCQYFRYGRFLCKDYFLGNYCYDVL